MTLEELYDIFKDATGCELTSMVKTQIKKLKSEGYTYKEIGRCIYYFYVIKQNDVSKIEQYGIGIVRNIRQEANSYYDNIAQRQKKQRDAAMQVKNSEIQEIVIQPVRRSFHRKRVDISGLQ